jgi:hypothetical protein
LWKKSWKKSFIQTGTAKKQALSNASGNNKQLLPILNPAFNLREVAKQMILLEDHLEHQGKRCGDCCIKHSLTIEALLLEAKTLDSEGKYQKIIYDTLSKYMKISKELETRVANQNLEDDWCHQNVSKIRNLRKPLVYITINQDLS